MKKESTPTPAPAPKAPQPASKVPDDNGLAIASLVLGILSFCGFFLFTGIPAIITGALSLRKGQKERGMSIAGIILGGLATLLSLVFALIIGIIMFIGMSYPNGPEADGETFYDESMPVDSTRT